MSPTPADAAYLTVRELTKRELSKTMQYTIYSLCGGLGLLAIIVLGVLFWKKRQKKNKDSEAATAQDGSQPMIEQNGQGQGDSWQHAQPGMMGNGPPKQKGYSTNYDGADGLPLDHYPDQMGRDYGTDEFYDDQQNKYPKGSQKNKRPPPPPAQYGAPYGAQYEDFQESADARRSQKRVPLGKSSQVNPYPQPGGWEEETSRGRR